ncbi:hypothetical protein R3P38DRAFT_2802806 [Favolaschia claudopus]|uniref:Uncharacterized protein n=1 Tax=Favolaschia claudopus TaxID=2862362 RepID=A0AAV9ZTX4_9AGAR
MEHSNGIQRGMVPELRMKQTISLQSQAQGGHPDDVIDQGSTGSEVLMESTGQTVTFHPHTRLYRLAKADIWSVIPAFPDNSAPIPRQRGKGKPRAPRQTKSKPKPKQTKPQPKRSPPKPKPLPPLIPKPTPIELSTSFASERALLSYIIKYTQDYTVGPLDYCGTVSPIESRVVAKMSQGEGGGETGTWEQGAWSGGREGRKGSDGSELKCGCKGEFARAEDAPQELAKNKKKRHSADRDLAEELSPRKRRRVVVD